MYVPYCADFNICPLCFVLLDCHNVDNSQLFHCCNDGFDGSGVDDEKATDKGRGGIGIVVIRVLESAMLFRIRLTFFITFNSEFRYCNTSSRNKIESSTVLLNNRQCVTRTPIQSTNPQLYSYADAARRSVL